MISEETLRDLTVEVNSRPPDPVAETLLTAVHGLRRKLHAANTKLEAQTELLRKYEQDRHDVLSLLSDPPTKDSLPFLARRAVGILETG